MKISKQIIASAKELIDLIGADDVEEVEIERKLFGRGRIRIVRASQQAPIVQTLAAPPESTSAPVDVPKTEDPISEDDGRYHTLLSPMVGMFYQSPNPEAPPYATEGDEVARGQTLCIIEAMKIMNEIECDVNGRVVRVLVENAAPVEYNTPLFLIDPEK